MIPRDLIGWLSLAVVVAFAVIAVPLNVRNRRIRRAMTPEERKADDKERQIGGLW